MMRFDSVFFKNSEKGFGDGEVISGAFCKYLDQKKHEKKTQHLDKWNRISVNLRVWSPKTREDVVHELNFSKKQ